MSDTTEIQALIDAAPDGATVTLDPGRVYNIDQAGSAPYGLLIPPGKTVHLDGRGAALVMGPGTASMSTLMIRGAGCVVRSLRFQAADQPAQQHRHGLWVEGPGNTVATCLAQGMPADGFYAYTGADDLTFLNCTAVDNGRNGITFGGAVNRVQVIGGIYQGSAAQQLDVEPGNGNTVNGLTILNTTVGAGPGGDYAITLGDHGQNHKVLSCNVTGGIYAVWTQGLLIDDCRIAIPPQSTHAPLEIWRSATDVQVTNCVMHTGQAKRGIWLTATGPGNAASWVLISGTWVYTEPGQGAAAIEINGALRTDIDDCRLFGPNERIPGRGGIMIRPTVPGQDMERVMIQDTLIDGFGDYGIVVGHAASRLKRLQVNGCDFGEENAKFAMDATVAQLVLGTNTGVPDWGAITTRPTAVVQL